MGIDVLRLLDRVEEMREACRLDEGNPGSSSGSALARHAFRRGRGGLRPLGRAAARRVDRQGGERDRPASAAAASPSSFGCEQPYELGQEFFRWEFATAVAGSLLGINPFDQPDVQSAKDKTNELLARGGDPPVEPEGDLDSLLAHEGSYVAVLAFVDPAREHELEPILERVRATGLPWSVGLGPRYLHSTGQLHKGGPPDGLFVQVVDDLGDELPIPGRDFGFRRLIAAQAAGDFEALRERGRRDREGARCEARHGRPGAHGRQHDRAAARARARSADVRPVRRRDGGIAGGARLAARTDPRGVADDPRRPADGGLGSRRCSGCSSPATSIVDGGNSYFRDSIRRHGEAAERGVHFIDAGVSGGIWGREVGYCLMVGGEPDAVAVVEPAFRALAPEDGYAHVGVSGRRPLREDGPQRDRVRADGGVRRGFRADEPLGVRPRPEGDRRNLALRLGRALVAARPALRGVQGARLEARGDRAVRRGLRAKAAGRSTRRSTRTSRFP